MFPFPSLRCATSSLLKNSTVAVALFAAAFCCAPRQASAVFEDEAYNASYESFSYSWYAYTTDGFSVEYSYQYWATVYSYYGWQYAYYANFYDLDSYFAEARDYHLGARDLWQDLIDWNLAGNATIVARDKAQNAANWCWWAWFL